MKTLHRLSSKFFSTLLLAFFGVCLIQNVFGTPPGPQVGATITFADGHVMRLRARDQFRAVPIAPGEMVTVDVQLPAQFGDAPAFAQPLDGGTASEVVIGSDGTTSFTFKAGTEPGLYRLLLGAFGRTATLQFEVPARTEG